MPRRRGTLIAATATLAVAACGRALGEAPPPSGPPEFQEPFVLHAAADPPFAAPVAGAVPFQPAGVSSRLRRLRTQFDALAADAAWDQAIELLEGVGAEAGGLAEVRAPAEARARAFPPRGHALYEPVAHVRRRLLAALPPEGLADWNDRVEATGRRRCEEAAARLDGPALARLADECFASPVGAEAALAAAELALERGDTVAARRVLGPLTPLASDPFARPAGIGAATLSPDADPVRLGQAWRSAPRPDDLVAAPDDAALLPRLFVRLALASIREGDLRRAGAEARLLRALVPDAVGRIAGRDQPLADALDAILAAQRAARSATAPAAGFADLRWAWLAPATIEPTALPQQSPVIDVLRFRPMVGGFPPPAPATDDSATRPALRPVVRGAVAYCAGRGGIERIDLTTGRAERVRLPFDAPPAAAAAPRAVAGGPIALGGLRGRIVIQGNVIQGNRRQVIRIGPNGLVVEASGPQVPQVEPALSADGPLVFARMNSPAPFARAGMGAAESFLLAIDPAGPADVAEKFAAPEGTVAGAASLRFAGPPASHGERVYAPVAGSQTPARFSVACYQRGREKPVWVTEVGSGSPDAQTAWNAAGACAAVGDSVYLTTDAGAVAALDAVSGAVRWVACYPRTPPPSVFAAGPAAPPQPPIVVGDRVVAAPADAERVFAWDAATGRLVWESPRPRDARIAGVADSRDGALVVVTGLQVTSLDALTGSPRMRWPESQHAGLRGSGDAAIARGVLYWPTRDAIYQLDPLTGVPLDAPIDLRPLGAAVANVVATEWGILVSGPDRVRLLAEPPPQPPREPTARARRSNSAEPERPGVRVVARVQ